MSPLSPRKVYEAEEVEDEDDKKEDEKADEKEEDKSEEPEAKTKVAKMLMKISSSVSPVNNVDKGIDVLVKYEIPKDEILS